MYYGWVVAGSGFLISAIGIGSRYSYGVFLKSLELELGMSRTASSTVFSVYMILCAVIAFLGGWVLDRYGPRRIGVAIGIFTALSFLTTALVTASWQLLITYSLLLSLGTGAIYGVMNSTTSRWFQAKKGLAVGFTSSGAGVGMILISPFASYLIYQYSWRTTFVIMGILSGAVLLLLSLTLKKDPAEIGLLPDGIVPERMADDHSVEPQSVMEADLSLSAILRKWQLWQLGLIWLVISIGLHLVIVHLVPYAQDRGVDHMQAALLMSLVGLANISGRLPVGRLSDRLGRRAIGVICTTVQCCVLTWLIWADSVWMLYGFALLFGLMWGGIGTIITALVSDVFGNRQLGLIMGIVSSMWAIGAAVGPTVGGLIYDTSGNYAIAFGTGAAGLLIASVLIAGVKPLK